MNPSNSFASASTAAPRFPYTLPGVIVLVAIYASIHALTRLLSSGNLGEDDPLDNLIAQTLAPGYNAQHGPLYDWALWLVQQVFGSGLQGFLLLKYALLVAMAGCLFQITRKVTQSALWAFIAVESMATVYQIFWRFHEGFTHRVGAMVLAVATVWAIFRLVDRPSRGNYLLLATLIGLGLLTEHIYVFALFATLLAAWLQASMRKTVFSLPMLAMLPVTLLIVTPYALWVAADPQRVIALGTNLLPEIPAHSLPGIAAGLRDAFTFPLLVLSPYIVILPMVFPAIFRTIFRQSRLRSTDPLIFDPKLFLLHILLIELSGLVLFNGLLYSRSNYAVHSILPMLVIAIPWLTEKARETNPKPRRVQVFMAVLLGFTITAYAVRSGNLFVYEPFCSRCRWGVPYTELAEKLREQGFDRGTIMVNDPHVGGNLRRFFPDARVVMPSLPVPENPAASNGQKIALVWPVSDKNAEIPADLRTAAGTAHALVPPAIIELPWKHLWKPLGYRTSTWGTAIMETTN
ncbi:glycosyltransferase family 39 protein [Ferribacterium limneticum]|uniref:glycosyltransferase family 39 protein n=1 Tax=Ferribacterium limneticum TaxID=76259 RepID=UPI001CF87C59|nr:glycosyltransferase family 39 protein [Ferribacterium limneticum]UCV21834.1 glycosyltransferase family 39 protein [Ferribacterium limneticum]